MSDLMAASGAASVVASGVSGWAQYQKGQSEQAAYDYNSNVVIENMKNQEITSEDKYAALMGRQRSAFGKSGVEMTSGSPLLVLANTAMQGMEEHDSIEQAGTHQAALDTYYGQQAAYAGTVGGVNQFLSGLSHAGLTYTAAQSGAAMRIP